MSTPSSPMTPAVPVRGAGAVRAVLGECALWCDREQALWWTDIESRTLHRLDAAGRLDTFALTQRVGSFALCRSPGRLLLGLEQGVALYDWHTRRLLGDVVPVQPEQPTTRINDGRCDTQGRFVFGTFNEARDGAPIGAYYRVDERMSVQRLPLPPVTVANGIAFSPDGTRLYWCDSPTRCILTADYHPDGTLGPPQEFARLAHTDGFPDGAAVDAEGGLWVALWDGGAVVRFDPSGAITERQALPVTRPTCPVFGGAGLDTLFVTTARIGLSAPALAGQPLAGAVLACAVGRRGLPPWRFAA